MPYTYYEESAFNVSRIHPLGGPDAGGTQVSVFLADESFLTLTLTLTLNLTLTVTLTLTHAHTLTLTPNPNPDPNP